MVRFAPSLSNTAVLLEYKKLRPVLVVESMVVFITLYLGVALGDLCIFFYVFNLAITRRLWIYCVCFWVLWYYQYRVLFARKGHSKHRATNLLQKLPPPSLQEGHCGRGGWPQPQKDSRSRGELDQPTHKNRCSQMGLPPRMRFAKAHEELGLHCRELNIGWLEGAKVRKNIQRRELAVSFNVGDLAKI